MKRLLSILVLAACLCAGQAAVETPETPVSAAKNRVNALAGEIGQLLSRTPAEQKLPVPQWLAAMDALIVQIHAEVDRYVIRRAHPGKLDSDRRRIENDLRIILSSATEMPPIVFSLHSDDGDTLIVNYALRKGIMMGPGATSVRLRSYRAKGNRIELSAWTGSDMDGYQTISVKQLHPPTASESWILMLGYMSGANGPNSRMRIYARNSGKFRTMWMPANEWRNVTVRLTDFGFSVEGAYYREIKNKRETYNLGSDGVYVVRPRN
jgi:hypothetical protein